MSEFLQLRDFDRIVFFTGAGLSAESGVPTYRGKDGIWQKYRYTEYACQEAFDRGPEKVWDFHDQRRAALAACSPNQAHRIIAAVQQEKPACTVVTQNIDGLHQRAGAKSVIELHGSIWRVRCDREGLRHEEWQLPAPRRCPCGAYYRPDVVWFGDPLDVSLMEEAERALLSCDILVAVGTSASVYPAAALPEIAMQANAVTVEINLEDTPLSGSYQYRYRGAASECLEGMWRL